MPLLVVSNLGEIHLLERSLLGDQAAASIWHFRIFTNNYTPNRDTVLADLTEASWPGYLPKLVTPATWGAVTNPSGSAISYYGTNFLQWVPTSGGPFDAWGYFVTFDDGATLLWSARFDAKQLALPLNPCLVWPVFTGHSQSEPPP